MTFTDTQDLADIENDYRETFTRWLQATRDYPYDHQDEPECICPKLRAQLIRDFGRAG